MRSNTEIRDHVISTAASLAVGFVGYFLARLLSERPAEAVALSVVAGIITHLIFDRIAYQKKIETTRNEIIETLRVGTPFEAGYDIFDREQDAVSYLAAMLPTAKLIWNTRISDHSSVFGMRFRSGVFSEHDNAILEGIKTGAECRFVIQKQRRNEIDLLVNSYNAISDKRGSGGLIIYAVDFAYQPVTQILIFETRDGNCEALIGWGIGKESDFQAKVLRFRDRAIVDFYKGLFERYTLGADAERI